MPILFADDTNLFCTGRNIYFLVNEINDEMSKVYSLGENQEAFFEYW